MPVPYSAASAAFEGRKQKLCFICGCVCTETTPDTEAPYRCQECFAAVAANEADGEL